jgi:hypothetical protein
MYSWILSCVCRLIRALTNNDFYDFTLCVSAAQRFALPACGRAWILFGSRKNPKPEKCLKMPQNPTRQVHALLGNHEPTKTLAIKKAQSHTDKLAP